MFCDKCEFLNPKEEDSLAPQIHWCSKLNERIKHLDQHPKLPTPTYCPIKK